MKYSPPTPEVRENVLLLFNEYKKNEIIEDELLSQLNLLQDEGKINQTDREILGWEIIAHKYFKSSLFKK